MSDIRPVLIARFARLGWLTGLFVRIKLRIFPLFDLAEQVPLKGKILDLGCGRGLLGLALTLMSQHRQVFGMDLDVDNVAWAAGASANRGRCVVGDLQHLPFRGLFDCIVVSDILYLIPNAIHGAILKACYGLLAPGGVLLLKEMNTRPRWKFIWNWIQETVAVKVVGWTLGNRFYFQDRISFVALMRKCGFEVEVIPLDRGSWYPHIVYRGVKGDG